MDDRSARVSRSDAATPRFLVLIASRIAVLLLLAAAGALVLSAGARPPKSAVAPVGEIRLVDAETSSRTTRLFLRSTGPIEVLGGIRTEGRLVVLLRGVDVGEERALSRDLPGVRGLRLEPGPSHAGRRLARLSLEGIRKGEHTVSGEGNGLTIVLRDPVPVASRRNGGTHR